MLNQGYFVTGTNTGVGKTVVSAILASGLGYSYWKPVQTGSVDGTDRAFVARWIGEERCFRESYVFEQPASPHLASASTGIEIRECDLTRDFSRIFAPVVVEGAGGVLVPLNERWLIRDLIAALRLPVIVVASTRLGTINHTLLTLEALRLRAIEITGVVTVGEPAPRVSATIQRYGEVALLGHVDLAESFSRAWFLESFQNLQLPSEGA